MKRLFQTWLSDGKVPYSSDIALKVEKLRNFYDDFSYELYDDDSCREEVKRLSPKFVSLYDSLRPYSFRSDFARYAILYMYGGYYYDIAICPEKRWICKGDGLMYKGTIDDVNHKVLLETNFMFFREPGHPLLEQAIERSAYNVKNRLYTDHPLMITGPLIFGDLDFSGIDIGEVKWTSKTQKVSVYKGKIHYKHKNRKAQADLSVLGCKGINNYEKMWFARDVYN